MAEEAAAAQLEQLRQLQEAVQREAATAQSSSRPLVRQHLHCPPRFASVAPD